MTSATPLTIGDLLAEQVRTRPHAAAIEAIDRAPLTYADLADQMARTRRALRSFGMGPTDRVAVVLPDGPEAAVTFLSIASCAAVAPLNPAYRSAEFALYLKDLRARAVVIPAGSTGDIVDVARACGISIIEIVPRGACAGAFDLLGERRNAPAPESAPAAPDSVTLLLHTSGTTARPKLVSLTHANICASARNSVAVLDLGPLDRSLALMPLFHIHGLVRTVLSSLSAGGAVICTPGFQAPRLLGWLQAHKPTWYAATPAIHQAILDQAVQQGSIPVPSTLRLIRTGAAAVPPRLLIDLERVFGVPVIAGYGMTETAGQITSNPLPPQVRKPGSVGIAAGPEVAVIDEHGLELGPGQVGEIVVRGSNVMRGYERNPDANAAAFVNGWLRTGDQGYRDEDGYFFLTGRLKEIINRGGEKIAPREVDETLLDHPSVAQAVTFGVPDRQLGETVAAAVVLKPGARLTQGQLREFTASRLAFFKVPYRIVFLQELPKGPTGKLQRVGLATRLGLTDSNGTGNRGALVPQDARSCDEGDDPSVRPRTFLEQALVQLWTAALGVPKVGLHDDFFELGGNSILAVQILFQVRQRFDVNLRADVLFRAPTVARLAQKLEQHLGQTARPPVTTRSSRARPMTSTERRLVAIWEKVLDVRPIGVRDHFFDLGGQSHHIDHLFAEIQAVFGEGLPVRALHETPTIEGLARTIDGTERSESALIAPFQSHGSHRPLFAIHAGAGYVFFYRALASRLGREFPFYAVQAQGHVGGRQRPYGPNRSVEQLAARYIREIQTIQPHGPYNLAGASFGGIVAFEMARQLRAQGEKIDSLFLFSPHVRNNPHADRDGALANPANRRWRHRIGTHLVRLSQLETGAAVKYVIRKIVGHLSHPWRRRQTCRRLLRLKVDEIRRGIDWRWCVLWRRAISAELINDRFMKASHALVSQYRPGDFDGRAILFRAATDEDPVPLWTGLALDGLEVHDTPGGHLDMLDEPTVGSVADLIRPHLESGMPVPETVDPDGDTIGFEGRRAYLMAGGRP